MRTSSLADRLGDELYDALRARRVIEPLSCLHPGLTIEDAYRIQQRMLSRRIADGQRVIEKKIGVTSKAVMEMLDVYQPDFGYLTDRMLVKNGAAIPLSTLIQPKAEGEIAFLMERTLKGPGVTASDVLAATKGVMACFEIVDSRIRDWQIRIQDTVADNASCGVFALGDRLAEAGSLDLKTCGMVLEKNGEIVATGAGAAALGDPLNAVAWRSEGLSLIRGVVRPILEKPVLQALKRDGVAHACGSTGSVRRYSTSPGRLACRMCRSRSPTQILIRTGHSSHSFRCAMQCDAVSQGFFGGKQGCGIQ